MRRSARVWTLGATLAVFLGAAPASGHNRDVIHPHLTREALELVRHEDFAARGGGEGDDFFTRCRGCAYDELFLNTGQLRPFIPIGDRNVGQTENNVDGYKDALSGVGMQEPARDVVLGSVIEDGEDDTGPDFSDLRVVHHFYHSRSGRGLTLPVVGTYRSSLSRAQEIFLLSLRLHDYDEQSRRESYLYLGRVLHLVEDLSSPAHVHDNVHGLSGEAKDDYEGRWVPHQVWVRAIDNLGEVPNGTASGSGILAQAHTPAVVTRFRDIWSAPRDQSNAHLTWASSADQGFSASIFNRSVFQATLEFPPSGTLPPPAQGELASMFSNGRLRWVEEDILDDHWKLDELDYHHTNNVLGMQLGGSEWWPVTAGDGIDTPDFVDEAPGGAQVEYYLEQLQEGDDPANALVPDALRVAYSQPWHPTSNPTEANTAGTPLAEVWARHLLAPVVAQVAGFAKWWFQIANTPPYLVRLEAHNDGGGTAYLAEWVEDPAKGGTQPETLVLIEENSSNTYIAPTVVIKRTLQHDRFARAPLHGRSDVVLTLTFNEPVREITEITIGSLDVKAASPVPTINGDDTEWTFVVPASEVVGDALNGELVLTVKAIDKNDHWPHDPALPGPSDCRNTGHLDQTPQTPAKRKYPAHGEAITADILVVDQLAFPWHDENTDPAYAYECADGDQNHRLLFDTAPPVVNVGVSK